MKIVTRVKILYEAVCVSNKANNFGNGINPVILPFMGKYTYMYIYTYTYIYIYACGCAVVKWFSSKEMNMVTRVQTMDEAVCISLNGNNLVKGMDPVIFLPAMRKIVGLSGIFNLGNVSSIGEIKL